MRFLILVSLLFKLQSICVLDLSAFKGVEIFSNEDVSTVRSLAKKKITEIDLLSGKEVTVSFISLEKVCSKI